MVRLEEHKTATHKSKIERIPFPPRAYIPLIQHIGKPCDALVKVGDSVRRGEKIASVNAHVSAPIHASVSGKVIAIQSWPHPVLGRCKTLVIESDGEDHPSGTVQRNEKEVAALTVEQLRAIVLESGIVGLGGATFPTHIKLTPPKAIDTVIINGAECEPYLTGDYRLMLEKTHEILRGIALIVKCVAAKRVYIAIEDNKPEAVLSFRNAIRESQYEVRVLSYYPQGGEKQLIRKVLRREVPSGKLPFDVGVLVQNVGTCFAMYEAVYSGKPLYERVVTVTGSCLAQPRNILVRVGTPIKDVLDFCGPVKEECKKVIMGGPMMGIAQFSLDAPVIKSTSGLLFLNERESAIREEIGCIRCGACVRECPVSLMPCEINLVSLKGLWQEAKRYGALDCIECGLCNYVCPAQRMLLQSIRRAKMEVR